MNDDFDGVDGGDKLVALMRSAASVHDAPPPAFDHSDVLAGSHRITRRHRMIAAGATGLVLIASIGTAAVLPMLQSNGGNSTSVAEAPHATPTPPAGAPAQGGAVPFSAAPTHPAPSGPRAPDRVLPVPGQQAPAPQSAPQPGDGGAAPAPPPAGSAPDDPGTGGGGKPTTGGGNGDNGHSGNGQGGNGPRDEPGLPAEGGGTGPQPGCQSGQAPNLSAIVGEVVPEASGGSQSCRSNGDSAVQVEITKDGKKGTMTVVFSPKGGGSPGGTTATTASGGKVGVSVQSSGEGPAPYADELGRIASELASRL
jgi:hypothetical protein